jgi:4-amino-4-deoxy-L-arabinose transferase-like glycosyltransferase
VDEAHYALYAAHLALSYFDHPPLVGWIQWPLVAMDAPTAVLRLIPELFWLGTALLVQAIAQRLQVQPDLKEQAGFWAVLALALSPLLHVLGIGLLPDTLLMFFSAAVMWLTLELMEPLGPQRAGLWVALGVLLGLAGLSKYTAILAVPAVAVGLLQAHGWRVLTNRFLWLAVGVALLLVTPVGVWNYQNHWISFTYQGKHGAGSGWSFVEVLRFAVVQLLVFGPLMLWGAFGRLGELRCRTTRLFFAVPFLLLAVAAGGGTSLPHWTAPAWVTLAPFAGVGLARSMRQGWRWWVLLVAGAQALGCVAVLGLMVSAGVPFTTGTQGRGDRADPSNPFADLHGWSVAGEQARKLAAQHGLHSVSAQNWTLASRLGWYARPLPVHVLEDRFDQFDLWAGDLPAGGDTLLVDWSQLAFEVPLGAHGFASCQLLDTQDVQRFGVPIAHFRFLACRGWSGDPQPRLLGSP